MSGNIRRAWFAVVPLPAGDRVFAFCFSCGAFTAGLYHPPSGRSISCLSGEPPLTFLARS